MLPSARKLVILSAVAGLGLTVNSVASDPLNNPKDMVRNTEAPPVIVFTINNVTSDPQNNSKDIITPTRVRKTKVSPVIAMTEKYNDTAKNLIFRHKLLSERLETILRDENAASHIGFDAKKQLANLNIIFSDFEKVHNGEEALGDKRSKALELSKNFLSLDQDITSAERLIKKHLSNQGRKAMSASAEALLRNQQVATKADNSTREAKKTAKEILEAEKRARHIKLTRPGAQGPNAIDRNEQKAAHEKNRFKQRPYQNVEFVKLAKGKVPPAAMETVVFIRNILRKSANKEQVIAELAAFEKDIDLKEISPAYINLTEKDVDTVYQMRINDRYRAIIAFKAGLYKAPDGSEIELDLLYENTIRVCDPHK